MKGKTCSILANGLNLYDLKKKLTPEAALTLPWGYIHNTILVKQVYWYISQVSGERLQDHWSSGFFNLLLATRIVFICHSIFKFQDSVAVKLCGPVVSHTHEIVFAHCGLKKSNLLFFRQKLEIEAFNTSVIYFIDRIVEPKKIEPKNQHQENISVQ